MIEPVKLHATLKPIQQLNGTLSAGVPIPGPPGPPGLSANVAEYQFNSNTSPPPGDGQIRFNNAVQTLASKIWLDDDQATGVNIGNLLTRVIGTGTQIYIQDKDDGSKWQQYEVVSAPVDGGTYVEYSVSWMKGGSPLTEQRVMVAFFIPGEPGEPGPPGLPNVIQDEGIALTPRTAMNFVGIGVTVTDDAINSRTVITIPGGGSQSPWTSDIDAANKKLMSVNAIGIQTATPSSESAGLLSLGAGEGLYKIVLYDAPPSHLYGLGVSAATLFYSAGGSVAGSHAFLTGGVERMRISPTGSAVTIAGDCNLSAGSVYRIGGVAVGQTPWTSDINGGNFDLFNVKSLTVNSVATIGNYVAVKSLSAGGYAQLLLSDADVVRWGVSKDDSNSLVFRRFDSSGGFVANAAVFTAAGAIQLWLGGSLKTLSVDGSGFVKAT